MREGAVGALQSTAPRALGAVATHPSSLAQPRTATRATVSGRAGLVYPRVHPADRTVTRREPGARYGAWL